MAMGWKRRTLSGMKRKNERQGMGFLTD